MTTQERPATAGPAFGSANGSANGGERTLGQLVADATADLSEIMRAEVALAKAELKDDARNGLLAGGMFGAAGYLAFLSTILLTIAAAYGLVAAGLPAWAGFLVLAVFLLVVAGLLALIGKSRVSKVGPPERAIRSTKQTIAAVRPGGGRST
jgi:hypothetical protein